MELKLPNEEEAENIKNGHKETIEAYFLDNLDYIKRYAKTFCKRINDYSELEDYINEIFINFKSLSFENERYFGHDCFKIFCRYYYGGQRKREQLKGKYACQREEYFLDAPVKGLEKEGSTVGDTIAAEKDILEDIFPKPDITDALYLFLSDYLAKEQKRVFEQFYFTGKTYNEIAEELGKSPKTVKRTREEIFKKFRKNQEELKDFLERVEYEFNVV